MEIYRTVQAGKESGRMRPEEKIVKTPEEAIETIKSNMPTSGYQMLRESLAMAIEALKEIQQYHEIGTVEECREAVEKQKAKKCVNDFCPDHTHYKCPSCGKIQKTKYGDSEFGCILNYCSNCGQALDENLEEMKDER